MFSPFYIPVYFIRRGEEEQIFLVSEADLQFSVLFFQPNIRRKKKHFKLIGPYEAK